MADYYVGIEGHTDNIPIARSGWKSNWELSSARALAVLHYLEKEEKISPERLSAIGYGEFQPVASNDTKDGRQANRRVEIVIMPKLTKVTESKEAPANLK
jgi:chemotaxis protein MotB